MNVCLVELWCAFAGYINWCRAIRRVAVAFAKLWFSSLHCIHCLMKARPASVRAGASNLAMANRPGPRWAQPVGWPILFSRRPVGREAARGSSWPPAKCKGAPPSFRRQTQRSTRPLLCRPRASHRTAPAAKDIWSGQRLSLIVFFPVAHPAPFPSVQWTSVFNLSVSARIPFPSGVFLFDRSGFELL